jgi:hypothetical protein
MLKVHSIVLEVLRSNTRPVLLRVGGTRDEEEEVKNERGEQTCMMRGWGERVMG